MKFKKIISLLLASSALMIFSIPSQACNINARVNVIGNEFPAIQTIIAEAKKCTGAEVKSNLTADHEKINVAGMQSDPAQYTGAVVSNGSIVSLLNNNLIRPLNDLIAKHGQGIKKNQLITVDGKVMAVAFMANAQHFFYRTDVLKKVGADIPKTYTQALAAAQKIRNQGIMKYPIGGAYKSGWNLAQEFNNMFLGYGGSHFKNGSAKPNVNSKAGIKALKMMKALSQYMNPDYLTHDSNATSAEFRAGNVAMMSMWGSRAATLPNASGVPQEVKDGFAVAGPLSAVAGSIPASTLWWDGWTIAKNISDAEAEATFKALANGIRPELMNDEQIRSQAIWLINGYKTTQASIGVVEASKQGTIPYPMLPYMGLMHTAIGNEISDFMQGKESVEQALKDVEAAYTAAAREKGYL